MIQVYIDNDDDPEDLARRVNALLADLDPARVTSVTASAHVVGLSLIHTVRVIYRVAT